MTDESSFLNPSQVLKLAHISEGQTIADFGAGAGFFTRAAARISDDTVVWAVDDNGDMLSRVKSLAITEGLRNVEILRGNIESPKGTGLPQGHFDWVIAANILFSADNKKALVQEINRVLKKNGRALVIDWTASHGGLGPHPDHVVRESAARALFEEAGFTYVGVVPAGKYHWGCIVRKKGSGL